VIFAEQNVAAANVILGNSAQEAAKKKIESTSRERYDSIMTRVEEAAEVLEIALPMIRERT